VCKATKDDWRDYLDSENQALKSKRCEWIEGTIYIVEPSSQERECFSREVEHALLAQRGFDAYMTAWGSAVIPGLPDLPDYEPDDGYGPANFMGAPFPPGVQDYLSWYTLIIEVGKWRSWGYGAGMLDWKAAEWAQFPGVRYILCVKVTDRLATADYKLYRVERGGNDEALPLPELDPVPVVGPQTMVTFDSRELLGLPPGENIPSNPYSCDRFPDPSFSLDLYEVLETAWQEPDDSLFGAVTVHSSFSRS
ncbi:hypothetical protein PHYSODRAFT_477798, partial [Phytophthora sojae]